MKYQKIEKPNFTLQDTVTVKAYSDNVAEVTQMHYDIKPDPDTVEKKNYRTPKYKTSYSISKELKKAREKILTNIEPEDLEYTYFLTLTRKEISSFDEAKKAWNEYQEKLKEKYGSFKYFSFYERSKTDAYHIHALIWDPNHTDRFSFIKFESFKKMWGDGEAKISKPNDYDGLIRIAFYVTKQKNTVKIPRDEIIYEFSDDLKETPLSKPFNSEDIKDMDELCNSSYRLYDDKNHSIDVSISRTIYINKKLIA